MGSNLLWELIDVSKIWNASASIILFRVTLREHYGILNKHLLLNKMTIISIEPFL